MRRLMRIVAPCALILALSHGLRAEDKEGEWTVTVTVKDNTVVAKTEDKEYTLTGEEAKKIKEDGKYVVKGKISADGKSIETTEIKKAE